MKQVEDISKLDIFLDDWFRQIEDATSLVSLYSKRWTGENSPDFVKLFLVAQGP